MIRRTPLLLATKIVNSNPTLSTIHHELITIFHYYTTSTLLLMRLNKVNSLTQRSQALGEQRRLHTIEIPFMFDIKKNESTIPRWMTLALTIVTYAT